MHVGETVCVPGIAPDRTAPVGWEYNTLLESFLRTPFLPLSAVDAARMSVRPRYSRAIGSPWQGKYSIPQWYLGRAHAQPIVEAS